jgi:hypothetical protein
MLDGTAPGQKNDYAQRQLDATTKRIQDAQGKKDKIRDQIIQNRPANKGKQPVPQGTPNNPRGVVNPSTGKPFAHIATNKKGESQGSDDGKTWVAIKK